MPPRERYEHGEFCWVDLASLDFETASKFYAGMFGWTLEDTSTPGGPRYGVFLHDGSVVAGLGELSAEDQAAGAAPTWNAYVAVRDIDEVAARVEALGGTVLVPPTAPADHGRLAFFIDPQGAVFAAWQAADHHGSGKTREPGAPAWHELATPEVDAASAFYGDLLGWSYEDQPIFSAKYHRIRATPDGEPDGGGMLQMNEEWEGVPPHWMVYLAVADIDACVAYCSEHGGQVGVPPFDTPVGRISVLCDPHGAVFSVIEHAETT